MEAQAQIHNNNNNDDDSDESDESIHTGEGPSVLVNTTGHEEWILALMGWNG